MAWYVESLVLDRERIKQNFTDGFIVESDDGDNPSSLRVINRAGSAFNTPDSHVLVYISNDLDNPLFNDLLLIEKVVDILLEKGELNLIDVEILNVLSNGDSLVSIAQREGTDTSTLVKYFFTTCNKISYELQGHFTDAGYIKYMCEKYNLNSQQTSKMIKYMQKSRRTRIRRLINDKATY
jgi:hypothetical protein